jgi:GntR family transcriptional repressor for pyruvate dehydrogenase complex
MAEMKVRMGNPDPVPTDSGRWGVWSVGKLAAKASRRSIVDDVRERLMTVICSGEVKVNDRLPPEVELARLFGVSRPVVREAIVSLNAVGVTASFNGRGTFVTSIKAANIFVLGGYASEHVNEIRRLLEIPAAQLAAMRRTDRHIEDMRDALDRLDAEERADRRNRIDAEFHVGIAAAAGNPLLEKLAGDLRTSLEDESLTVSSVSDRRAGARAEHRAILAAIECRDAQRAGDAMRAHLDAIDDSLARLRQSKETALAGE